MNPEALNPQGLLHDLEENYRREREAEAVYRHLAEVETNPSKKEILLKLAEAEQHHAERWAARLKEFGGQPPEDSTRLGTRWRLSLARWLGTEATIRRQEAAEERDIAI